MVASEFVRSKVNVVALGLFIISVLTALFAPTVAPHDPLSQDLMKRLLPPAWIGEGTGEHILGTDTVGRDVLSRVVFGARISMGIGLTSATIAGIFGVLMGLISGFFGRGISDLIMRITDAQLSFPFIIVAITIAAVVGSGLWKLIIILTLWGWAPFARVARSSVLSLKEREFILASRALGAHELRIMFFHILPNILSAVVVIWTFTLAQMILAESTLSFLGFGIQPPTPSWGEMLTTGRQYISSAWWLSIFPGVSIMLTVLAVNLLGDGLRDALDPNLRV
jgi:peptide/nickel transport system permease protein